MLYHLIMRNPNKDITLHVSVNSSAMVRQFRPNTCIPEVANTFMDGSYCIIGLVSRLKNSLLGFTKITWILNLVPQRTPLGCVYDNSRSFRLGDLDDGSLAEEMIHVFAMTLSSQRDPFILPSLNSPGHLLVSRSHVILRKFPVPFPYTVEVRRFLPRLTGEFAFFEASSAW
jgi:hypothetical protein